MPEEKLPISEKLELIEGTTLYKTKKWWSAVALLESFGRRQVVLYLWLNKDGKWKRQQKFTIQDKDRWPQIKETIEGLVEKL
ncbi:MAG: hypothetical protein CEE41_00015 [Hadesarchaea archaeon B3_Hades]|nr:MAG: hypothetical protein CEE41_00015 [Hadesarchaea archaeon B3_Hades]